MDNDARWGAERWYCFRCDQPATMVLLSSTGELAGYACEAHAGALLSPPSPHPAGVGP